MVTPIHGAFSFVGTLTGMTYSKDIYISDVVQTPIRWDSGVGATATSDTFWIAPEPVLLVDVSVVTGPTVMGRLQLLRNGVATGDMLGIVEHVSTSSARPRLRIPFATGAKIAANQIAV